MKKIEQILTKFLSIEIVEMQIRRINFRTLTAQTHLTAVRFKQSKAYCSNHCE